MMTITLQGFIGTPFFSTYRGETHHHGMRDEIKETSNTQKAHYQEQDLRSKAMQRGNQCGGSNNLWDGRLID